MREYVVFKSELDLNIVRRVDNPPLFEGKAVGRSQTDELGTLVPNLIEAMFTNFPGENGKTVKITVPGKKRPATAGSLKEKARRIAPAGPVLFGRWGDRRPPLPILTFELAGQQADVGVELGILGAELLDLPDRVDHRGVVAPAEAAADLGQRAGVSCLDRYIATCRGRATSRARRAEVISALRMR